MFHDPAHRCADAIRVPIAKPVHPMNVGRLPSILSIGYRSLSLWAIFTCARRAPDQTDISCARDFSLQISGFTFAPDVPRFNLWADFKNTSVLPRVICQTDSIPLPLSPSPSLCLPVLPSASRLLPFSLEKRLVPLGWRDHGVQCTEAGLNFRFVINLDLW